MFFRRKKQPEQAADVEGLVQTLVRIGKLSPTALSAAMLAMSKAQADEELLQRLISRRVITQQDVEVAREVQVKTQAGQPIYEEWAKLENLMAENRRCAQELTDVITARKDKRRKRGEDTVLFLTPKHIRTAT